MNLSALKNLSDDEAKQRLALEGPNEVSTQGGFHFLKALLHVLKEPLLFILLACALIYLLIGDTAEGILLCLSALFMIFINLYQNKKTENALQSLKGMAAPRALVWRQNRELRIPGREVVREDLVILNEGDRIPADAELIDSSHLSVDESMLTGESVPVRKQVDTLSKLYSGTLVVKGRGIARVTHMGAHTEMGKIGKTLAIEAKKDTRLQSEVLKLGRVLFIFSLFFSAAVILAYGYQTQNWNQAWLSGLAAALSMLPEELPVVMTLYLAIGASRIAKQHVLTRKASAIENLGAITILCVDKTGTLTKNEMQLRELVVDGNTLDLAKTQTIPETFHRLVEYGVLSSHRDPFDPMEKAILYTLENKISEKEHQHPDWQLRKEYPLTNELLAMSCVWEKPNSDQLIIAAKGAPEAIMNLCHLPPDTVESLTQKVSQLASKGLRILAVAKAAFVQTSQLPNSSHEFQFEWIGLLGLEDPLRSGVPEAIKECQNAGVRVVMMTGDYPETARKIATEAGFGENLKVMGGAELDKLSLAELKTAMQSTHIFARMRHDQKLKMVKALRENHEVVAMTGDGVNDAPSLKNADIGIAMGMRGTDVAREASDIVLMNDDFQSIVTSIRLGRTIYGNIKNAVAYVLALHIPVGGMTLVPALLGWPMILFPIHLVLLELLIDPSCSLALESIPPDADIMHRKPRSTHEVLFQTRFMLMSCLRGIVPCIIGISVIYYGLQNHWSNNLIRSFSFLNLVASVVSLFLVALPYKQIFQPSRIVRLVLIFVGISIPALYNIPQMREIMHFERLNLPLSIWAIGLGLIPTFVFGKLFSINSKNY